MGRSIRHVGPQFSLQPLGRPTDVVPCFDAETGLEANLLVDSWRAYCIAARYDIKAYRLVELSSGPTFDNVVYSAISSCSVIGPTASRIVFAIDVHHAFVW